jgi:hypothetical protein
LRVLAVNVTQSDDLGRVTSVVLIERQQPHRKCGGSEICKPEIRCDDGGDARHVGRVMLCGSMVSSNTSDILPTLAL